MSSCSCNYDGVPFPREMPQDKGFGLTSTFQTVVLLWMGRPSPCPASTGVVLNFGPPRPLFYAALVQFAKLQLLLG